MKKIKLMVTGGRGDKIAQFYNCGKSGDDLYGRAADLMEEGDSSAVESFIDENFESPDVETFMHSLDEDNCSISVTVEDESGATVFSDEQFKKGITQSGFVLVDPRKWEYDESMGEGLTARIRALVSSLDEEIAEALEKWKEDNQDRELDETFGEDYISDISEGVSELIVQSPFVDAGYELNSFCISSDKKSPELLFATMCADLYGTACMECELVLEDDEEFDPAKLRLLLCDYDGFYYACSDAVLPVVLYGNKFYRLSRDTYEAHYSYYGFAKKKEGGQYFEFEGENF